MISPKSEVFLAVAGGLLSRGHRVRFRAEGDSMHPAIRGGEAILVEPVSPAHLKKGDIALYLSGRGITAHRVVKILAGGAAYSLGSAPEGHPPRREERPEGTSKERPLRASRIGNDVPSMIAKLEVFPKVKHSSNEVLLKRSVSGVLLKRQRSSSETLLERSAPQVKRSFFVLRGDAPGSADEPVEQEQILGKVVSVERAGGVIDLNSKRTRIVNTIYIYAYHIRRTISNHIRTNGIMEKWNIGIMGW
jgi:hypothetical protein